MCFVLLINYDTLTRGSTAEYRIGFRAQGCYYLVVVESCPDPPTWFRRDTSWNKDPSGRRGATDTETRQPSFPSAAPTFSVHASVDSRLVTRAGWQQPLLNQLVHTFRANRQATFSANSGPHPPPPRTGRSVSSATRRATHARPGVWPI